MEIVKEWKRKELEGYFKARDYYIQHSEELSEASDDAKSNFFKACEEYKQKTGKEPEKRKSYRVIYEDAELDKLYQLKENTHYEFLNFTYNNNHFYRDYGYRSDFKDKCVQEIDKHFNTLQAKVEKKIGTILKIESLGGDDYLFQGENGNCKVEVIWAGGYNIQRLHTRWVVKK